MSVILVMGNITCDDNYVIEIIETIVSAKEMTTTTTKPSADHIYGRSKNKSQLHCMHAKSKHCLCHKVLQKLFITNDKLNEMHTVNEIARKAELR